MASGDAPEQEVSAAEVTQFQEAKNRWNQRIDDGLLDLEKRAVAESKFNHSEHLAGQGSAELAMQEEKAMQAGLRGGADYDLSLIHI